MENYMKIASEYLDEFEGWSLYPGWKSRYTWAGVVFGIVWLMASANVLMSQDFPATFLRWDVVIAVVFEILWLAVMIAIGIQKDKATLRVASEKYSRTFSRITDCRMYVLTEKLGVAQSNFLSIAKECKELSEISRAFQNRSDSDIWVYLQKIYDPDAKARLMSIVLAAISIVAALTLRSMPSDVNVFELLSDQSFHKYLGLLLVGTAFLYFVWIGVLLIGQVIWEAIVMWVARSKIGKGKSLTALRYLVRDLVRFHKLSSSS